jgi:protocatechuate 3,4-dioxygenase alpha subunit
MMSTEGRGHEPATPSQTIGPFFHFGMARLSTTELVPPGSEGALTLDGRVLDGNGEPVPDAMVEIWQADRSGQFTGPVGPAGPGLWQGWGRCLTGPDGTWRFTTVKPGRVDDEQAPHIGITLFCRGILQRLISRVYFPDEVGANTTDPVLMAVGGRAATLVAREEGKGSLRHDIVLQGTDETVFFVF